MIVELSVGVYLECEVLPQVLDDHYQERQLDAERLLGVRGAGDVSRANVCSHYFQHARLDIRIGDTLDVAIPHFLVPDLEGFASY